MRDLNGVAEERIIGEVNRREQRGYNEQMWAGR